MDVTIDITRMDYWEFNKYAILNIAKYRNNFLFSMISVPLLSFIIMLFIKLPFTYSLISSLVLGALADLLLIYFSKKAIMKFHDDGEGFLGRHVIKIGSDGLTESTSVNQSFHSWKGIKLIKQNENYIFIFIDKAIAHIIPKRCFSSKKEAEDFYNLAVKFKDAA